MPVGHYWLRQDWKKLDGSIGKGRLFVAYISEETTYRRKPARLVISAHGNQTLEQAIATQTDLIHLEGPIAEPSFD